MQHRRRPILAFFATSCLIYGLLVVPWPALEQGYGFVYRRAVNRIVGLLDLDRPIVFQACTASDPRIDTCVAYRDPDSGVVRVLPHRGGDLAYLATAFLVALIVATPIRWRRRWSALVLGLLVFNGFLAFRMCVYFSLRFESAPQPWLPWPDLKRELLFLVVNLPWFVAPIFVWGLTVCRAVYAEARPLGKASARKKKRRRWRPTPRTMEDLQPTPTDRNQEEPSWSRPGFLTRRSLQSSFSAREPRVRT